MPEQLFFGQICPIMYLPGARRWMLTPNTQSPTPGDKRNRQVSDPFYIDLAARAIGLLLEASVLLRFRVSVRGLENFTHSPSTVVVFNHRRDIDIAIIGNSLYGGRSLLSRHRLRPSFMAREDMFRHGFLTNYLTEWPWPARKLLSWLNLSFVFVILHAYPMRRIAERTLGEVLEDMLPIFGNLPLDRALRRDWVREFERLSPERRHERPLRIKDVLNDRYRPLLTLHYGLLKLTHERFRKIRPYEQRVIESQLQKFVELLDRGEILQMAPEGAVSLDGRFSRIRRGLHVLLNRSSADVRILPVCISYDSMDLGRPRVFLNIGKEITGLKGLMPSELSARVTQAILAQTTITASHLAGQFILDLRAAGKRVLHRKELMCYVAREAEEWVKRGMYVDPRLLNSSAREMRIKRLLEYAVQTKTLDYTAAERYLLPVSNGETARDGTDPHRAIEFVVNQIISVREG